MTTYSNPPIDPLGIQTVNNKAVVRARLRRGFSALSIPWSSSCTSFLREKKISRMRVQSSTQTHLGLIPIVLRQLFVCASLHVGIMRVSKLRTCVERVRVAVSLGSGFPQPRDSWLGNQEMSPSLVFATIQHNVVRDASGFALVVSGVPQPSLLIVPLSTPSQFLPSSLLALLCTPCTPMESPRLRDCPSRRIGIPRYPSGPSPSLTAVTSRVCQMR